MHKLDPRLLRHERARQMAHGAVAGSREGDGARLLARRRQIVVQGLVGAFGARHQHQRRGRDLRDRREVLQGVEAHILVKTRIDGHDAGLGHHEGVAIGFGARHLRRAYVAARARAIFHHDALTRDGAELLCDQARRAIIAAPGRKRRHHGNGLLGIVLQWRERLRVGGAPPQQAGHRHGSGPASIQCMLLHLDFPLCRQPDTRPSIHSGSP
ncbi:hypothetical protein D3C72_1568450 [compost metagenome]